MRYRYLIIALACMLSAGPAVLGQDLSFYEARGKLTPLPSAGTAEHSLVIYKQWGILFHVHGECCVKGMTIFHRPQPVQVTGYVPGIEVIPGLSAYGITLGMTPDQVRSSPYLQNAERRLDDDGFMVLDIDEKTSLIITFSNGKVSQVQVNGAFSTQQGISSASTGSQVTTVYGMPDQRYAMEMKPAFEIIPRALIIPMILTYLIGLVTGLAIRKIRLQVPDMSRRLAVISILGALGMAIAFIFTGIACVRWLGMGIDGMMMFYGTLSALVAGAAILLVMELSSQRFGRLATLGLVTLAVILSNMVFVALNPAFLTFQMGSGGALSRLTIANLPFLIGVFHYAGMGKET